jgi:hypothetical protein
MHGLPPGMVSVATRALRLPPPQTYIQGEARGGLLEVTRRKEAEIARREAQLARR